MKEQSEEKRKIITDKAMALMKTEGLKGLSANRIAKSLGWNPSLIFYYFKKQDDLFLGCLEEVVARNRQIVLNHLENRSEDSSELNVYLRGNLDWSFRYPDDVALLLAALSQKNEFPKYAHAVNGALETGRERIAMILQNNMIKSDENQFNEISHIIHTHLMGEIISRFSERSSAKPVSPRKRQQLIEESMLRCLRVVKSFE